MTQTLSIDGWVQGRSRSSAIHRTVVAACKAYCAVNRRTWARMLFTDRNRVVQDILRALPPDQAAQWRLHYGLGDLLNPRQTPNIRSKAAATPDLEGAA